MTTISVYSDGFDDTASVMGSTYDSAVRYCQYVKTKLRADRLIQWRGVSSFPLNIDRANYTPQQLRFYDQALRNRSERHLLAWDAARRNPDQDYIKRATRETGLRFALAIQPLEHAFLKFAELQTQVTADSPTGKQYQLDYPLLADPFYVLRRGFCWRSRRHGELTSLEQVDYEQEEARRQAIKEIRHLIDCTGAGELVFNIRSHTDFLAMPQLTDYGPRSCVDRQGFQPDEKFQLSRSQAVARGFWQLVRDCRVAFPELMLEVILPTTDVDRKMFLARPHESTHSYQQVISGLNDYQPLTAGMRSLLWSDCCNLYLNAVRCTGVSLPSFCNWINVISPPGAVWAGMFWECHEIGSGEAGAKQFQERLAYLQAKQFRDVILYSVGALYTKLPNWRGK